MSAPARRLVEQENPGFAVLNPGSHRCDVGWGGELLANLIALFGQEHHLAHQFLDEMTLTRGNVGVARRHDGDTARDG